MAVVMTPQRQAGFTLVEMMVAITILAVVATMSWAGLDSLLRTQARTADASRGNAEVQIALGQWTLDLDQSLAPTGTTPMHWDGQVFRLTRRAATPAGLVVVAWAPLRQQGQWWLARWQSQPVATLAQWRSAWTIAAAWGRGVAAAAPALLLPLERMEVQVWAGTAWAPRNSAGDTAPEGLRLLLDTPQGRITKDWVNPGFGATTP